MSKDGFSIVAKFLRMPRIGSHTGFIKIDSTISFYHGIYIVQRLN